MKRRSRTTCRSITFSIRAQASRRANSPAQHRRTDRDAGRCAQHDSDGTRPGSNAHFDQIATGRRCAVCVEKRSVVAHQRLSTNRRSNRPPSGLIRSLPSNPCIHRDRYEETSSATALADELAARRRRNGTGLGESPNRSYVSRPRRSDQPRGKNSAAVVQRDTAELSQVS